MSLAKYWSNNNIKFDVSRQYSSTCAVATNVVVFGVRSCLKLLFFKAENLSSRDIRKKRFSQDIFSQFLPNSQK